MRAWVAMRLNPCPELEAWRLVLEAGTDSLLVSGWGWGIWLAWVLKHTSGSK